MTALLVAMLACAGAVITVNEIQQADRSSHRNPGFGVDCCAIVDIDGDSRPDIAVGSAYKCSDETGDVFLVSSKSLKAARRLRGRPESKMYGEAIAALQLSTNPSKQALAVSSRTEIVRGASCGAVCNLDIVDVMTGNRLWEQPLALTQMDGMPVLGVWIAPLAPAAAHVDPKWHLDTTIVVCAQKSATSVELSWVDCDKREVTRRSTVESVPGRINGCPLCRVGDVDGDGVDDLALMGLDHVFVYSTVTGKQVLDIPLPTLSGYRAPTSACKGADIDGDGIADILIGRPDPSDCLVDGSVAAYSGKTGKHLLECNEASRGWGFGASLLSRDSSGDASVLVGKFAFIDGGVDVLSGRTLKRTAWIPGPGNESDPVIGARLFSSADFDGDGVPDVLVSRFDFESAGDPVQGVLIYSGKNYSLLGRIELGKTLASDR